MPKVYFCTKIKNFATCGETNPDNFPPGRYSTCKECRNKYVREYNKDKKDEVDEEKSKQIESHHNIRYLIIDTICNTPIISGKSIENKIRDNDDDISQVLETCGNGLENFKKQVYIEFGAMMKRISDLEKEIQILKTKESLKNN
jgi:hypothetical protein